MRDKAFDIAKNPKDDGYQKGLASMVYKSFDKKISGSCIRNENISNKELAAELQKPIIGKFEKRKAHSSFIDYIWGADFYFPFLLGVNYIFRKYAGVIALKDKKALQLLMFSKKNWDESNHKPNKI